MTTAFTVDSLPLKWPFAGSHEPVVQTQKAPTASRAPAFAPAFAGGQVAGQAGVGVTASGDTAVHVNAQPIGAFSSPMTRFGVSRRQMIGDVGLVLMWAAIIPGLLWFGHAAGF